MIWWKTVDSKNPYEGKAIKEALDIIKKAEVEIANEYNLMYWANQLRRVHAILSRIVHFWITIERDGFNAYTMPQVRECINVMLEVNNILEKCTSKMISIHMRGMGKH